jgi:hypothetical protein
MLSEDLAITVILASPCSLDQLLANLPCQVHTLAVHAAFPSISASSSLELDCVSCTTAAAVLALRTCAQEPVASDLKLKNFGLYRCGNQAEDAMSSALALAVGSKPCSVHFNGVLISPEYLQTTLEALSQNQNLRKLEATYFRTFRSLRSGSGDIVGIHHILADGLSRLTSLQSLSLQDISFAHKAHRFLPEALKMLTELTELKLDSCIRSALVLSSFLSSLQKLQGLEISYTVSTEEEASAFASCISTLTVLTGLTLSGRTVSFDLNDYSHILMPSFRTLVGLKSLHLLGSGVRDAGTAALSTVIRRMRHLEALTVGVFRVCEETVAMIESLARCCCTHLVLQSEVNIRATSGRLFCEKIGALTRLAHLHVPRFVP